VDASMPTGGTALIASLPVRGTPADAERAKDMLLIKIVATALFAASVVIAIVARFVEPYHWSLAYVAAWAEAAAIGGLADWYAVVALFVTLAASRSRTPRSF
jgi:hypothetical protein